jgi:hypothetical protein
VPDASAARDVLGQHGKMQSTFTHKLLMCMVSGFAAAAMLWVFRHFVQQAFWESGEGWKESLSASTAERAGR